MIYSIKKQRWSASFSIQFANVTLLLLWLQIDVEADQSDGGVGGLSPLQSKRKRTNIIVWLAMPRATDYGTT